ncbi:MAG TPA: SAM-dependent methyltransferase [Aquabacterium sp.]|uniref:class I SAM-dependent methyltransferase n=1 Tax=Aquabacterium sp. TaxID=1872578 RepID=UPI002E2F919E|nr:SAM-dependent methyltransferase [Aquabacterium sp.]HEX5372433.1 SAM-dependent methyltransferase [Aquabacterium sp.]
MNRPPLSDHSVVSAPVSSEPLSRLIAHEIQERGGWLRFDRFMELALYAPGLGYYSGGRRVLGALPRDGSDFVTAPELTPLFGETLAHQVEQALEATGTREVWEFGAGTGALAEQLLSNLGDRIDRYTIVDLSGTLRDRQHQRLVKAQPELVHKVIWADSLPDTFEGVVVGNEVLDAMPVQLMVWDGRHWLERGVSVDASQPLGFVWEDRPAEPGARPPTDRPDDAFVPGTVTETHAQAEAFVATLAQRMTRGAAFFVDYGFPEAEYYHPQRTGGTLMCHHLHMSDPDPLIGVGHKDITTHVNFTGIALAGQEAGWEVLGYTSQGRFLSNCGLAEALAATGQASTAEELRSRAAMQMLVAEHEMGELFKVIGFVKGPWFDALGFRQGDRTHTL